MDAMIRRTHVDGGQQVDFVLEAQSPVSVVGDFNDWDPARGAMHTDDRGTRSWSTVLQPGRYSFRYLRDGEFFDDPDADEFEPNGYGQSHAVLIVDADEPRPPDEDAPAVPAASAARKRKPAAKPAAKAAAKTSKTSPAAPGTTAARRPRGSGAAKAAESVDLAAQAEHRLSILSEIDAGRSVQVHGAPDYLDHLRQSLLDASCSMYLSDVDGERVLVVDPSPGESGTDVVDLRDAPST